MSKFAQSTLETRLFLLKFSNFPRQNWNMKHFKTIVSFRISAFCCFALQILRMNRFWFIFYIKICRTRTGKSDKFQCFGKFKFFQTFELCRMFDLFRLFIVGVWQIRNGVSSQSSHKVLGGRFATIAIVPRFDEQLNTHCRLNPVAK